MFKKASPLILAVVLFSFTANAQSQTVATKTDAWELGVDWGVAAMQNALGNTQSNIDKPFDKAVQIADKFSIKLPPLPAKTNVRADYTRRFIDYFIYEEKAAITVQKHLKANFSEEHAAAFDLGLATHFYFFLQIYGDAEQAKKYSPLLLFMVEDRTNIAKLPIQTTEELVNLDDQNPTKEIVKKTVFKTIINVTHYFYTRDKTEVGDRLAAQEKYTEAIALYTKVIEDDPNFAEAYLKRGEAQYLLKEYDSAIADFTKFIAFADKNSYAALKLQEAYGNRCISYYYKKDFVQAENDCTALININKDYRSAYYFRAHSRLAQGNIAGAIDDFTKVIEMTPNAVTYYYRGAAYQKIGKEDLAKLDFEKAESLEPGIAQKLNTKKENQ